MKWQTKREYIAYRGIEDETPFQALQPGDRIEMQNHLIVNTSLKNAVSWKAPALMRIVIPKGARAISMSNVTKQSGEVWLDKTQVLVFTKMVTIAAKHEYGFRVEEVTSADGTSVTFATPERAARFTEGGEGLIFEGTNGLQS